MNKETIFMSDYHIDINEMNSNKLFCTFVIPSKLEDTLDTLIQKYTILYNKIFVLQSPDTEEYIITYNIDIFNTSCSNNIPCTILLHRKKEFNVLYSLNALNEVIKENNNGVLDKKFPINWSLYKNSILLTQENKLKQIRTKIFSIIEL